MPRSERKATFFCPSCGNESPQWRGFCPACGSREPLVEAPQERQAPGARRWLSASAQAPQELAQVSTEWAPRIELPFGELNRVLGGGIVPGSLVLLAGDPGIGKSTLLLQVAAALAGGGKRVLYASGEESAQQVKLRADRLGLSGEGIHLLGETNVESLLRTLEGLGSCAAVVVDSIQTMDSEGVEAAPGTVGQVRECARLLMRWAKGRGVPILVAGHVTKEGEVAGPRVLEHMVDTVLYLEGDPLSALRILRATKNRFGSTNEVAVFQMSQGGLVEVPDPSSLLLAGRREGAVGSVIVPVLEGSRPLLMEVQALTAPSALAVPRRVANGIDPSRLVLLAAVLSRRAGLPLSNQDIIVNVAGGLRVSEPAADLAAALAIASAFRNTPLEPQTVAIGEVGLSGELRSVPQAERRLQEAARLGFSRAILPAVAEGAFQGRIQTPQGVEALWATTLSQAIRLALGRPRRTVADQGAEDDRARAPELEEEAIQ